MGLVKRTKLSIKGKGKRKDFTYLGRKVKGVERGEALSRSGSKLMIRRRSRPFDEQTRKIALVC